MIPKAYIIEWSKTALWQNNFQIEQDLVIEKALFEIFSNDELRSQLAFRGGTALHKLYLKPQSRYSEDIDLVQVNKGEIGPLLSLLRARLSFLGDAKYVRSPHNNTLIYRFTSEYENIPLKLKIEINTREHFSVLGYNEISHHITNGFLSGEYKINTFITEELLGTKLRALYQRNKGRDLFDIWCALNKIDLETHKVIECFKFYMHNENHDIASIDFVKNMEMKIADSEFNGDIEGLLIPQIKYDGFSAYKLIKELLIDKI